MVKEFLVDGAKAALVGVGTFLMLMSVILALAVPCETEDSVMCTWDGSKQGNGSGKRFTAFSEDVVLYW